MKTIHPNSVAAYWLGSLELFGKRHREVIATYRRDSRALTDREVMIACRFSDMNSVRPRISELVEAGIAIEVGDVRCPVTGKSVRTVRLARREAQAEFNLGDVLTPAVVADLERRTA